MAQKILEQQPSRTDLGKPRKAMLPLQGVIAASTQHEQEQYPEVNAAIDKGLADVAAGRVHRMSFAEYAEISVED